MADIPSVYRALACTAGLYPVGPSSGAAGGAGQAANVLPQPILFALFKLVPVFLVFPPGGKVSLLYLKSSAVEGEDMVHTAIQKGPVMGYQDKAMLPG